ncbi:hypothetical protein KCP75_00065 [Salmonella enterica subsp. enterica]|nr:hypothetical protein KCP75_00065 [Salmonella enterica subsp. enterica]
MMRETRLGMEPTCLRIFRFRLHRIGQRGGVKPPIKTLGELPLAVRKGCPRLKIRKSSHHSPIA